MKYMLLMNYIHSQVVPPVTEWAPEDMKARSCVWRIPLR
jgi:hypothetical protein